MKRYYLAVMMLALCAGGVVWIAIKQRPTATRATHATPAVVAEPPVTAREVASASATSAPTPPSAPSESIQFGDAGHVAAALPDAGDAGDARSDQTFPPLANYAAWSVVRWTMSAADVEVAFREAGVVVTDATDPKTGAKRSRVKSGAFEATIEFGSRGAEQVVVTATNLSKEGAHAVVAKVAKERAPATKTIARTERHWKKDGGALASLTTFVDDTTATVREEHVRESSPGGWIGFAGLRWGMSTQEVVGQLTPAGYATRVEKALSTGPAPCSLPNPPPDCGKKKAVDSVVFTKGDVEGTVSFNQFGLRHVALSGPTTDGGAARAKELEASLGKPASFEASTKTQHVDHARMTSIDVEVTEKQPAGGLTVVETYRPK